jgi:glycosyltransferase involved in cell wall biosynthesis
MRIVVNTRLLLKNRLEGIGWFTYETLKRITRDHPEHQFIFLFDRPYDPEFVFYENVTPLVVCPPTRHPFLWYFWFEFKIPAILKKYKADLFLSPDGYLSTRTSILQLAVIHDLNFIHRPGDLPWLTSKYYNYWFPKFAAKAARIATVSSYSKKDISELFKVDPAMIDVVYNGCNPVYRPLDEEVRLQVRKKYTGGSPYFLYVGALHPRKNIEGLLLAFNEFKSRSNNNVKLVIAGGQMFKTGKIHDICLSLEYREEVLFTGRILCEELKLLLGSALALTFVPFFEGFGIPVVEAMGAGLPVICSNTTSLPEVGGNAVYYVDPVSVSGIADAMFQMTHDKALRESLIEKGNLQKEKFSWERSAALLWQSIEKVLFNP